MIASLPVSTIPTQISRRPEQNVNHAPAPTRPPSKVDLRKRQNGQAVLYVSVAMLMSTTEVSLITS